MSAKITLKVKDGTLKGKEFAFDERVVCTIGRANDCYLQLPSDWVHMDVSRHHCVLDIDPPHVRICDVGSRNGTYVNGVRIGQHGKQREVEGVAVMELEELELKGGDEVRLGGTVFRVGIEGPAACAECGCEIAEEVKPRAETEPNVFLCDWCREAAPAVEQEHAACHG